MRLFDKCMWVFLVWAYTKERLPHITIKTKYLEPIWIAPVYQVSIKNVSRTRAKNLSVFCTIIVNMV